MDTHTYAYTRMQGRKEGKKKVRREERQVRYKVFASLAAACR